VTPNSTSVLVKGHNLDVMSLKSVSSSPPLHAPAMQDLSTHTTDRNVSTLGSHTQIHIHILVAGLSRAAHTLSMLSATMHNPYSVLAVPGLMGGNMGPRWLEAFKVCPLTQYGRRRNVFISISSLVIVSMPCGAQTASKAATTKRFHKPSPNEFLGCITDYIITEHLSSAFFSVPVLYCKAKTMLCNHHSLIENYYTKLLINNQSLFYRPDALPVAQPTVSNHRREKCHIPWTCLPQAHPGVFQLCL